MPNRSTLQDGRLRPAYYAELDAARGGLMALGIVLHAAVLFSNGSGVVIDGVKPSPLFTYILDAIHLFRMPAFFMISGFFCALSIGKYPLGDLMKRRTKRVLLPFFSTLLTLNILEAGIRAKIAAPEESFASYYLSGQFGADFLTGQTVFHLWFLAAVWFYILTFVSLVTLAGSRWQHVAGALSRLDGSTSVLWLAPVFAASAYGSYAIGMVLPDDFYYGHWLLGLRPWIYFQYLPFFAAGVALFYMPGRFEALQQSVTVAAVIFGLSVLTGPNLISRFNGAENLQIYPEAVFSWLSALSVFGLATAAASALGQWARLFADMSYTVYLFHHLLVLIAGMLLIPTGLPSIVCFTLIVVVVSVLSAVIHLRLVARSQTLSTLFNGRHAAS